MPDRSTAPPPIPPPAPDGPAPAPLVRLPMLTEVVSAAALGSPALPGPAAPASVQAEDARLLAEVTAAVLAELQPRIDLVFEYRVREALAPLLARLADAVIREARDELAGTLRETVAQAVGQELRRRRR